MPNMIVNVCECKTVKQFPGKAKLKCSLEVIKREIPVNNSARRDLSIRPKVWEVSFPAGRVAGAREWSPVTCNPQIRQTRRGLAVNAPGLPVPAGQDADLACERRSRKRANYCLLFPSTGDVNQINLFHTVALVVGGEVQKLVRAPESVTCRRDGERCVSS